MKMTGMAGVSSLSLASVIIPVYKGKKTKS